jgi:hypothetical protein
MTVGRLIGGIVVILVLFAIIYNPQDSAESTSDAAGNLADAGSQVVVFFSTIVANVTDGTTSSSASSSSSSSSSSTTTTTYSHGTYYPHGGVETGDGSTAPGR